MLNSARLFDMMPTRSSACWVLIMFGLRKREHGRQTAR